MNEIRAPGLIHDRYKLRFSQLLQKLNRSVQGKTTCSVSKECGACRTCQEEMRGPLKEQIQNAINKALQNSLRETSQVAYINTGGRRRNRKKKKNKKNNGVSGSAWSIIHLQANEPPARCRVDIPPKAKGGSPPQVTRTKKTCKDIKARMSPPRRIKDTLKQNDDKPLINEDATADGTDEKQLDLENNDPNTMPLSSLFKTTKGKKNKKTNGNDGSENFANDDVTIKPSEETEYQGVSVKAPTDDLTITPQDTALTGVIIRVDELDADKENDTKTDLATGKDAPAVLYTTGQLDMTVTGEGPHFTHAEEERGAAVEVQPLKADGSLHPETGREKQSLLHDHNPEGMICCVIL